MTAIIDYTLKRKFKDLLLKPKTDSNGIRLTEGNRHHRRELAFKKKPKPNKVLKISKKFKIPKELRKTGQCNYYQSYNVINKLKVYA